MYRVEMCVPTRDLKFHNAQRLAGGDVEDGRAIGCALEKNALPS